MAGLSDAFRLTAACCRWPPSPARDTAVRSAASALADWPRFLRVVKRQRVEGLAHDALSRAGVAVPAGIAAELAATAGAIARQNLAFAAESARLQALLDAEGIDFLFVKGVTLAMLAYGNLAVKKAWDIDLAVQPGPVLEACALLEAAGYERIEPGPEIGAAQFRIWVELSKESMWRHPGKAIVVELHSGFVDNPRLLPGISVGSPRQSVAIGGGIALPTLRDDTLFAYLCVHGATHAWSRLKWIADVAALLARESPEGIERLYRESVRLGTGRCVPQALLLCDRLFGTALPPALKQELAADWRTRWLVRVALGTMAGSHGETELDDTVLGTVPIHVSHFFLGRGLRYKFAEARRKTLSPQDRATISLPRPLHFLYTLLLVPSWLWRRTRGPAG